MLIFEAVYRCCNSKDQNQHQNPFTWKDSPKSFTFRAANRFDGAKKALEYRLQVSRSSNFTETMPLFNYINPGLLM